MICFFDVILLHIVTDLVLLYLKRSPADGPTKEVVTFVYNVPVGEMSAVAYFTSVPPSSPHTDSLSTEEMS